jgi:small subunit ribosomal protein S8
MVQRVEKLKIAINNKKDHITRPKTRKEIKKVLELLCEEGYLEDWSEKDGTLHITLRYGENDRGAMRSRKRGSKNTKVITMKREDRWGMAGWNGHGILHSPLGRRTAQEARKQKTGGKVVLTVR